MRVWLYYRLSRDEDAKLNSLNNQRDILYTIAQFGIIRTNEMQRYIEDISFKTLSANLKELEQDGLIIRKEYPQVPPKVEYSLTEKGKNADSHFECHVRLGIHSPGGG